MSTVSPDNPGVDPVTGKPLGSGSYGSPPTEKKVKAAAGTTAAVVALLTAVLAVIENDQLVEGTPDWVPVLISTLLAAGAAFAAGKAAPHTARPDLPPNQR